MRCEELEPEYWAEVDSEVIVSVVVEVDFVAGFEAQPNWAEGGFDSCYAG
jgi:hypothetical protein